MNRVGISNPGSVIGSNLGFGSPTSSSKDLQIVRPSLFWVVLPSRRYSIGINAFGIPLLLDLTHGRGLNFKSIEMDFAIT